MPTPTHATLGDLFGDIANKIRAKTGDSGTIVADNFPAKINEIETPILQSKSATPSLSAQTITPTSPNNGLSSVSISAITKELLASLDADFVAGNIKKDVDLFGLIGTLEGGGSSFQFDCGTVVPTEDIGYQKYIHITNPIAFSGNTIILAWISNEDFVAGYSGNIFAEKGIGIYMKNYKYSTARVSTTSSGTSTTSSWSAADFFTNITNTSFDLTGNAAGKWTAGYTIHWARFGA